MVEFARLGEEFAVEIFVEAHDDGFSEGQARRPKVPRRTEHLLDLVRANARADRQIFPLLAFCDEEFRRSLQQATCVVLAELLTRRGLLLDLDFLRIQKLGRPRAARSALAVVVPVYALRHESSRASIVAPRSRVYLCRR